jgi:2-polyprenyl-3-methyl-5-hydroxy-6-metoxy-1,4-benzoquinol methylase
VLDHAPFDYILLQDVLEHVEDPNELLERINRLLAPGGYLLVGTPNADRIDIRKPDIFRNELHAPYHLHIYPRDAVERMGRSHGWVAVSFYDRSYHDRPWFGMNTRAAKHYQSMKDGSFDVFFERFDLAAALANPRWWYYAVFGYSLSYKSDLSIMFRKS